MEQKRYYKDATIQGKGKMNRKSVRQRMGKISVIMILTSVLVASGFSTYDYIIEKNNWESYFNEITVPIPKPLANGMRPSQAAKDTAALTEASVEETRNGMELVYQTNEAFVNMASGAKKNRGYPWCGYSLFSGTGPGNPSGQQGNGADWQVTSENVENTRETASAIDEIRRQIERIKQFVMKLVGLIGNKKRKLGKQKQVSLETLPVIRDESDLEFS